MVKKIVKEAELSDAVLHLATLIVWNMLFQGVHCCANGQR